MVVLLREYTSECDFVKSLLKSNWLIGVYVV
jgi:hypothetical protein